MEDLDLKTLIELFWTKRIQIVVITVLFVVFGVVYTTSFITPKYTASTTLVLATEQNSAGNTITTTDVTLNAKLISTYSELIKSKSVLRTVISNLNISNLTESSLKGSVSVAAVADTELIKISVTNKNPEIATSLANEIAIAFTEQVQNIYKINNVHVLDKAETPTSPSNINHTKDIFLFLFAGLVISIIYVILESILDTTVKTTEDIEKITSLPILAAIPEDNFHNKKGGKRK